MTGQEYRDALARLRLGRTVLETHQNAGALLGVSSRESYRYAAGVVPVSATVERLLMIYIYQGVPQAWRDSLAREDDVEADMA